LQFGFESFEKIQNYLGTSSLEYDYILVDMDSNKAFTDFKMHQADKNLFVTAFDNYSLKKGLEVIGQLEQEVEMTKVLFSRDMLDEENDYLEFLSFYFSIKWDSKIIFFPYDKGDNTVIIHNQRTSQIKLKEFDPMYKEGVIEIVKTIATDIKGGDMKKALKKLI